MLFSEPAAWEAMGDHCRDGRYEGICKILKAKYGDRVRDLLPTEASELWLYGDRLAGPTIRPSVCHEIFGSRKEQKE